MIPSRAALLVAVAAQASSCAREDIDLLGRDNPAAADAATTDAVVADAMPAPVCELCDPDGACTPVPDGTACAAGVCRDGACVPVSTGCNGGDSFRTVAAGEHFTCSLGNAGNMYCWGENADGQLGAGDLEPRGVPTRIGESVWQQLATGWSHACALRSVGPACWGTNADKQLGTDDGVMQHSSPAPITGAPELTAIAAGESHTCGMIGASLYCWGRSKDGEVGAGGGSEFSTPALVTPPLGRSWRAVATGAHHTCALADDGLAWCWGANDQGQLGVSAGKRDRPIAVRVANSYTAIAAGGRHTCALDDAGVAWCWGRNDDGELGRDAATGAAPAAVTGAARFEQIALGDRHTCAVARDSGLYCWGRNDRGQLGLGDIESRVVPTRVGTASDWLEVSAGKRHTCGVRFGGALFCWGQNEQHQLGLGDGDEDDRPLPTEVCPPATPPLP